MAVSKRDRVEFGRRNLSGATMLAEVGETEDSMDGAIYQEPGSGWAWAGGRRDRGLFGGGCMAWAVCKEQGCGWR